VAAGPECPHDVQGARAGLAALNAATRLTALTPNLVALSVAAPRATILVTPFPLVPGWQGWVDGSAVRPLKVNGAFVGLRVPAGAHDVRVAYFSRLTLWSYRVRAGALLGALAALIWLGLRAWPLRSRLLALAALFGAALPAYAQLETGFVRRAQSELVLPNNYAELLAAQLERWQKGTVTGEPTGH